MVKSKKMSKSSIAIIVLALLLVLSMVMGLTGAWFTDKAGHDNGAGASLYFGTVDIDLTNTPAGVWTKQGIQQGATVEELVPGSEYVITLKFENVGTEDVFFNVSKEDVKLMVGDDDLLHRSELASDVALTIKYKANGTGSYAETWGTALGSLADTNGNFILKAAKGGDVPVAADYFEIEIKIVLKETLANKYEMDAVGTQGQAGYSAAHNLVLNGSGTTRVAATLIYDFEVKAVQVANNDYSSALEMEPASVA
jgi:flagellar basal body-associated protein FliL